MLFAGVRSAQASRPAKPRIRERTAANGNSKPRKTGGRLALPKEHLVGRSPARAHRSAAHSTPNAVALSTDHARRLTNAVKDLIRNSSSRFAVRKDRDNETVVLHATATQLRMQVGLPQHPRDLTPQQREQTWPEFAKAMLHSAAVAQPEFHSLFHRLSSTEELKGIPFEWVLDRKRPSRALEKAAKYDFGFDQVTDWLRAQITCETATDAHEIALAVLRLVGKPGDKKNPVRLVSLNNRYADPKRNGYREISMILQFSNGHQAELQIHDKWGALAKKADDGAYALARPLNERKQPPLNATERQLVDAVSAGGQALFSAATLLERSGLDSNTRNHRLRSRERKQMMSSSHVTKGQRKTTRPPVEDLWIPHPQAEVVGQNLRHSEYHTPGELHQRALTAKRALQELLVATVPHHRFMVSVDSPIAIETQIHSPDWLGGGIPSNTSDPHVRPYEAFPLTAVARCDSEGLMKQCSAGLKTIAGATKRGDKHTPLAGGVRLTDVQVLDHVNTPDAQLCKGYQRVCLQLAIPTAETGASSTRPHYEYIWAIVDLLPKRTKSELALVKPLKERRQALVQQVRQAYLGRVNPGSGGRLDRAATAIIVNLLHEIRAADETLEFVYDALKQYGIARRLHTKLRRGRVGG